MGHSTFTASLKGNSALLIDVRNAGVPYFEKDVFVYSDRLVVAGGDMEANGNLSLVLEGVTEVEGFNFVEDRNGTFVTVIPSSITYTTTAGAVKATIVLVANASATAFHIFVVCKV